MPNCLDCSHCSHYDYDISGLLIYYCEIDGVYFQTFDHVPEQFNLRNPCTLFDPFQPPQPTTPKTPTDYDNLPACPMCNVIQRKEGVCAICSARLKEAEKTLAQFKQTQKKPRPKIVLGQRKVKMQKEDTKDS